MDPNQPPNPIPPSAQANETSVGTFTKNKIESSLPFIMKVIYNLVGFIKNNIMNIFNQILNKD